MRIALLIEYHGATFLGWQTQPNGKTVQDHLNAALGAVAGEPVQTHAAGRTDTGVHALAQIVHFDTQALRPITAWVRGANAFLPAEIRVIWAKEVEQDFHARFSATARSYQYWLISRDTAPAIAAQTAGWIHLPLELSAMQQGAQFLLGEHDFSAFRASECQANSPIKHIQIAEVTQIKQGFIFDFKANAFLHHQVRNMVGALVRVGSGKAEPALIRDLLAEKDRTKSPPTFSPNGLYLTGVDYDARWALPFTHQTLAL